MADLTKPSEKEMAEWVVKTCLLFGASIKTAYKVAGLFVEGIVIERGKTEEGGVDG